MKIIMCFLLLISYAFSGDAYVGVGGTARKVTDISVGVGGVARRVVNAYVGVDGVAQQFWPSNKGKIRLPIAAEWTGIVYGNGVWVAVGNVSGYGQIVTSIDDGFTWTHVANDRNVAYTNVKYSTVGSSGHAFIVSHNKSQGGSATYSYSTDGINWTTRTLPNPVAGVTYSILSNSTEDRTTNSSEQGFYISPSNSTTSSYVSYDGLNWVQDGRGNPVATGMVVRTRGSTTGAAWSTRFFAIIEDGEIYYYDEETQSWILSSERIPYAGDSAPWDRVEWNAGSYNLTRSTAYRSGGGVTAAGLGPGQPWSTREALNRINCISFNKRYGGIDVVFACGDPNGYIFRSSGGVGIWMPWGEPIESDTSSNSFTVMDISNDGRLITLQYGTNYGIYRDDAR